MKTLFCCILTAIVVLAIGWRLVLFFKKKIIPVEFEDLFRSLVTACVKRTWEYLGVAGEGGKPLRVAIFGAGGHTKWMHEVLKDEAMQGPVVVAVIDEIPSPEKFWGLPVIYPKDFQPTNADALILSSDRIPAEMRSRCKTLYGNKIRLIDLYEGLPPGPHPK